MSYASTLLDQLTWEPEVQNKEKLSKADAYAVIGMGGSHLAADLLAMLRPELPLRVWSDYNIPTKDKNTLYIAISYSGNTEETLSGAREALEHNLPLATVTTGGELLELAKKHDVPHVLIPNTDIQPRNALGYGLVGLCTLTGAENITTALKEVAVNKEEVVEEAEELARFIGEGIPVFYAAHKAWPLATLFKIHCNESAKIPAFYNIFPELNHNELAGIDERLRPVILQRPEERPAIQKRIQATADILQKEGIPVHVTALRGDTPAAQAIFAALLAEHLGILLAAARGADWKDNGRIEDFKKRIA